MSCCADVTRVPNRITWVDEKFLLDHDVTPWVDLPLWLPPDPAYPGFLNVNVRKALAAGLTFRPLSDTVQETLAWAKTRPSTYVPRGGLTPDSEAALLSEFQQKPARSRQ